MPCAQRNPDAESDLRHACRPSEPRVRPTESRAVAGGGFLRCLLMLVGILVVFPLTLGRATPSVLRWLGGDPVHHCACGMKPGECGCPECARRAAAELEPKPMVSFPALTTDCGRVDVAPDGETLPLGAPSGQTARMVYDAPTLLPLPPVEELTSSAAGEPMTPPPKMAVGSS